MEIKIYQQDDERSPFVSWMENLKDLRAKAKILVRLDRISLGNFGDTKSVGEGVSELRIHEGKGYRVYFGREGDEIVLLLCAGNKASQQKDIKLAKQYWRNYCE